MNENVKKVLKENLWYVATCGDEMNVTPVGFKDVAEDGTLEIGAVIMTNTLANLKENDKIAIAACDPKTMECYQIKGTAKFVTEGPVVDKYQKMAEAMFKGAMNAKGAIIITPEKVIVASPSLITAKKYKLKNPEQTMPGGRKTV